MLHLKLGMCQDKRDFKQFVFDENTNCFKVFVYPEIIVPCNQPFNINLHINLFSPRPLVMLYESNLCDKEFVIVNSHMMIPANKVTPLLLRCIIYNNKEQECKLESETHFANMILFSVESTKMNFISNIRFEKQFIDPT